jgi:hypothetical protein
MQGFQGKSNEKSYINPPLNNVVIRREKEGIKYFALIVGMRRPRGSFVGIVARNMG